MVDLQIHYLQVEGVRYHHVLVVHTHTHVIYIKSFQTSLMKYLTDIG